LLARAAAELASVRESITSVRDDGSTRKFFCRLSPPARQAVRPAVRALWWASVLVWR